MSSWPSEDPVHSPIASSAVAALVKISADLGKDGLGSVASLLDDYKKQLQLVCTDIDQNDYLGLFDLIVIMDEGIDALIERNTGLDDSEIEFLAELPGLLADYLAMPGSRIAASILVKHFKKTQWIRPITLDEQQMVMSYILRSKGNDSPQEAAETVDLGRFQETLAAEPQQTADGPDDDNILDLEKLLSIGENEPDIHAVGEMVSTEGNDTVAELSLGADDDIVELPVGIAEPETAVAESHSPVGDSRINEQQQELIDLVKLELGEIMPLVDQLSADRQQELKERLPDLAEQAENIANAVNLMGLAGLSQASQFISTNIEQSASTAEDIIEDRLKLIRHWPGQLLACLEDVFNADKVQALMAYLQDTMWLVPMESEQAGELHSLLANPSFSEEDVEARQVTASEQDVSLELAEDVNQELLDGLLQDLPGQTEEFAGAIQHLNEGGSLADIEVAQRIAHTLKGAANVVGVRGIANLTHHLEDILELQAKAGRKPVRPLMDILVSAADCLETMSEALLGIDNPPDNAVQVLQAILDWANRLDQDGVPETDDSAEIAQPATPVPVEHQPVDFQAATLEKEAITVENMLRVPATLADELLRLAGENLISTGQVQEHIRNIMKSQDAIQLHNQSLQQISFDLEHLIDVQGIATQFNTDSEDHEFDPLEMDQYNEMHSVSRRLIEIAADSIQLTSSLDTELVKLTNLVIDQSQLQKESQELVLRTRMVPTRTIISRLRRGVRQACRVTGKQVELTVEDNDTYMDSEVLNDLIEPLMHILRNAVDHGIESPEMRKQSGKPETGCIHLTFVRMGDQIVINVEDDGQGLNLDKIKTKAIANGLLKADIEATDDAISRLVLEAGLSTRDEVTQVSGRGIGLDVVNVKIRELKGSINIYSDYRNGCRFELVLPISSFSTHSLLVRVRENIYAISNRGIEEILYPGLGELCEVGDETIFKLEDQAFGAILIDELLDFTEDRRQVDRSTRPILLVREESGSRTAILVQEVIDSRDVVVKSMGHYLPKLNGIIGATVLGDGSVAPVMDLPEMLQHRSVRHHHVSQDRRQRDVNIRRLPYVLVVDDSLSARRSLAQFVQDMGMDVRTARDGMEAVSLIEARPPDLMLVDMEMPRMNGLELTSHVRASSNTNEMPVIMITSRSTDKHRAAAMEKGVNHFMVKPFIEEELAQYINDALDIAS